MIIASYSALRHLNNPEAIDHAVIAARNPNQAAKKTTNNLCHPLLFTSQVQTARRQKLIKKPQKDKRKKLVIRTKIKMKKKMNIKMSLMINQIQQLCNVMLNT